jgi:hypothetical protein
LKSEAVDSRHNLWLSGAAGKGQCLPNEGTDLFALHQETIMSVGRSQDLQATRARRVVGDPLLEAKRKESVGIDTHHDEGSGDLS